MNKFLIVSGLVLALSALVGCSSPSTKTSISAQSSWINYGQISTSNINGVYNSFNSKKDAKRGLKVYGRDICEKAGYSKSDLENIVYWRASNNLWLARASLRCK
jgi:hypothetical protein